MVQKFVTLNATHNEITSSDNNLYNVCWFAHLLGRRWTWVRSSLTVDQGDVDESLGVLESLESSALWLLWLLLLVNLWSLRLNLTGTSQGTVNLTLSMS